MISAKVDWEDDGGRLATERETIPETIKPLLCRLRRKQASDTYSTVERATRQAGSHSIVRGRSAAAKRESLSLGAATEIKDGKGYRSQ